MKVQVQGRVGRKERGGWGRGWGVGGQRGGRDRDGEMGRGREVLARAGSGEGETGRVRLGGGNRKGETMEGAKGRGEEGARGEGISQMDMMKCLVGHMECLGGMRLQSFLTLFTRATPGTPASIV